jgi:hypothetical protein
MHDIREATKVDCAVYPQKGATSLSGEYFSMEKYAKALFTAQVSGQHHADSLTLAIYEAEDAAGTGASALGATITMAQGIKVTMATVVCTSVAAADTLIITPYTFVNGTMTAGTALTFTAGTSEVLASRQFDQSGTDAECGTSLIACINDATYGVPGMLAAVATATVTLTLTEPGDGVFTYVESDEATLVATDLIQQADFEVAVQDMDRTNDATHIQARFASIETDVATACHLIRAVAGYQPVGQVSAYNDDAS